MPHVFEDGIDCNGKDLINVHLMNGVDISSHKTRHEAGGEDAVALGSLAGTLTPVQHGTLGGGTLHAPATPSVAGFMSAEDKTKLNGLSGIHNDLSGRDVLPAHPEHAIQNFIILVSADHALGEAHGTVLVDAAGGSRTITLPSAVGILGRSYKIKKIDASMNTVVVTPSGTQTIDGAASFVLAGQNGLVIVQSDGANWRILSQVFGNDYQSAESLERSTTTSTTHVNKLTMTTPALRGTYRVSWNAVLDGTSVGREIAARLYNVTDAAVVGVEQVLSPNDTDERFHVGGYALIDFAGAAKTFAIQFRVLVATTAGIQDARIELWRVR